MNNCSILFVSHKYPPGTGGMEKQSYELIIGMQRYTQVHQIVYDGSESILHFFWKLNRRILKIVAEHPEIRLIHFNDGLIASFALYHSGYDHLKKTVTVHGLDVVFPLRYYQRKVLPRFNRFDLIIAVSEATAREIIVRGVNRDRVKVIANGIDHDWSTHPSISTLDLLLQKHHIPCGKKYLVLLGRPVKRKGFSWFIKEVLPQLDPKYHVLMIGPFAFKATFGERLLTILPSKWCNLIMLFLGYPSDQRALRSILQNPLYAMKVSHMGKIPTAELQVVLREAAAFIMPNISVKGDMEGFGLVCLEASSHGAIVFASALEGITDAIQDGKNGFLVESEDSSAWIYSLARLDQESDGLLQWRSQFRHYTLSQFGWDKMTRSYYCAFRTLLQQNAQKNS